MNFKNLSLSAKVLAGFIIIALIASINTYINLLSAKASNNITQQIIKIRTPKIIDLLNIKFNISEIKSYRRTFISREMSINDREKQYGKMENNFISLRKSYDSYDKTEKREFAYKNWELFKTNFKIWEQLHNKFISKSKELDNALKLNHSNVDNLYKELAQITLVELAEYTSKMESIIDELVNYNFEMNKQESDLADKKISNTSTITIILAIILFIIAISLGLYISRNVIKKPISDLINAIKKVIQGDFTTQIEIKNKDEIGRISEMINDLIKSRKDEITDLLKRSETIINASKRLLNVSINVQENSEKLNEQTSITAASSEQVSTNISTVSSAAEEMASSVKEIAKNTNTASSISNDAASKATVAGEVIDRLGKSSSEIGNIVKAINTIAEQTNLLALNATIEAARAGESGKGFAVVANEVKELAKEAGKATEDISNRIKMIQEESNNAINVIKEIIESITQINDISNTIASAVEEQTVTTSEITRNLSEATKGASTVAESNAEISKTVEDYRNMSTQIKDDAHNLEEIATSLKQHLVSSYKI
ncbi:MAG TPA: methyl-accepting chemotaxis protein [Ignavibacteria bacterium]